MALELVGIQRGAPVAPGTKWRVTWGVSTLHDIGQFFTFGLFSAADLQRFAANVYAKIFDTGWAIAASQPTINTAADAFTIDLKFTSGITGKLASSILDALDRMQIGMTLARVALISAAETSTQATTARETATTNAASTTGVTLGSSIGGAADKVLDWGAGTVKTALILAAVAFVVVTFAPASIAKATTTAKRAPRARGRK